MLVNPRTYKQSHTPPWYRGGGLMEPLPWVLAEFQYFGEILPLIESLWYALKGEVYIMGWGAAGGLWRHVSRHLGFYQKLQIIKKQRKLELVHA